MKIRIDKDEWYPVYGIDKYGYGTEVDVPEETIARWARVHDEFNQVQGEMRSAYRLALGLPD